MVEAVPQLFGRHVHSQLKMLQEIHPRNVEVYDGEEERP